MSATSSSRSNGSRPSRSTLLMKVMIGTSRRRQTSNNLRVCASMPLAASITITALSTAVSVRYVSSEKSSWPGVSSRLKVTPPRSNVITLDVTEMPRACSIFIQSDRARRFWPRARTSPAAWMAPPNSSNFSVSVVLPASGCEMIAKVRRFFTGFFDRENGAFINCVAGNVWARGASHGQRQRARAAPICCNRETGRRCVAAPPSFFPFLARANQVNLRDEAKEGISLC